MTLRQLAFALTVCAFLLSIFTVTIEDQDIRYSFLPRVFDALFLMVLFSHVDWSSSRWPTKSLLIFGLSSALISIFFASALKHFGLNYALVETRWIIFLLLVFLCSSKIDRKRFERYITDLGPWYVAALVGVVFLNNLTGARFYRPGVFGEANYDAGFIISFFVLKNPAIRRSSNILLMIGSLLLLQSKALLGFYWIYIVSSVKLNFVTGMACIAAFGASFFLMDALRGLDLNAVLASDRAVILTAFFKDLLTLDIIKTSFGQMLTGFCTVSPELEWYVGTQHGGMYNCNLPSAFHGQIFRVIYAFGIILGTAMIYVFLRLVRHQRRGVVYGIVFVCFFQSLFSNAFAGPVLFLTLILRNGSDLHSRSTSQYLGRYPNAHQYP